MSRAYLLTGGNMGERELHLQQALEQITAVCGKISAVSSVYETAAWGNTAQPAFLNQAMIVETSLTAWQLLKKALSIEQKIGRIRQEKYGPRIIDIDLLLVDDQIVDLPSLQLPHPRLQYRRFVLTPLAEIAPDLVHPVLQQTIRQLLDSCSDPLPVTRIN